MPARVSDSDAFRIGTPARCLLERIADKWAVLILSTLLRAPSYFLELHRQIGGVSRKVLTVELRKLERDGLIERRPDGDSSGVRYSLTSVGKSLCDPITALRRWAEKYAGDIERAQKRFDDASERKQPLSSTARPR